MLQLAYAERTTSLGCTATTEAAADTILTLPAVVLNGTEIIMLEYFCCSWAQSSTSRISFLVPFDALNGGAAAAMGRMWASRPFVASASQLGFTVQWRITPAAGSHVYSMRGHVDSASTFTIQAGAGGSGATIYPSYFRASLVQF